MCPSMRIDLKYLFHLGLMNAMACSLMASRMYFTESRRLDDQTADSRLQGPCRCIRTYMQGIGF